MITKTRSIVRASVLLVATLHTAPRAQTVPHAYLGETPWWNGEWKYRVPLDVTGDTDSIGDFHVRVTLDASRVPGLTWQYSCRDLRFILYDPEADTPYSVMDHWLFDDRITHGAWFACCASNGYTQYHTPAATYYTTHRPTAIRHRGAHDRTYFVYGDFSRDPAIRYFDHDTKELSDAIIIGRTQIPDDAHGNPSILIDDAGYIYAFYGCHHNPIQMRRSRRPEDISGWTDEVLIADMATYPQPWMLDSTTMILSYRIKYPDVAPYYLTADWSYIISTDFGATWTEPTSLIVQPYIYVYALTAVGAGDSVKTFHIAFTPFDYQEKRYSGIYYLYSDDGLETFKDRGGMELGPPPFDVAHTERVYDSGYWSSHINDFALDGDDNPYILFNVGPWYQTNPVGSGEWRLAVNAGGGWTSHSIAPCDHLFDRGAIIVEGMERIRAYLPVGNDRHDGGEIAAYASSDGGASWVLERMLTHESRYVHNYVSRVIGRHPEFQIFWSYGPSEQTGSSWRAEPSEVIMYGSNGIIGSLDDRRTHAYVRVPHRSAGSRLYLYYGNNIAYNASSFARTLRASFALLPCGATDPDLLVEWLMDDGRGQTISDNSAYGNTGIASRGDAAWAHDGSCYERRYDLTYPGYALHCDSSECAGLSQVQGADRIERFTVELWFRPYDSRTPAQPLAVLRTAQSGFYVGLENGELIFAAGPGEWTGGAFDTPHIVVRKWHHLAALYDGARLALYLDGMRSQTEYAQSGAIDMDGAALTLGAFDNSHYHGMIDEFRLYRRALSESEIHDHYRKATLVDCAITFGPEETHGAYVAAVVPRIKRCYPNPFNSVLLIEYIVPLRSDVTLTIHDVAGRRVRNLVCERGVTAGGYRASWDGCNDYGRRVASGVYFCRLKAGPHSDAKKVVHLK
jgi:hypothetical protein